MGVIVQKYGGSSLATTDDVHAVAERIVADRRSGTRAAIVVSARGDTTDALLRTAGAVAPHASPRELDQLLAVGEQASAALLAMAIERRGVRATSLAGPQTGIHATGPHGRGDIVRIDAERIHDAFRRVDVVVVAGFQGSNENGDLLTLGRGGSDTTAVALAAALGLDRVEICTDVDAVYTCDPRIEPRARPMRRIASPVMAEMAHSGARILHSRSVDLAALHGIDIIVRFSQKEEPGTVITSADDSLLEHRPRVIAVTHDADVVRVGVVGAGIDHRDLVAGVADLSVPLDLVGRLWAGPGEAPFDLVVGAEHAETVVDGLHAAGCPAGSVRVDAEIGRVSLVGVGMLSRPSHLARVLACLATAGVDPGWVATSEARISVTVPRRHVHRAVVHLHHEFGLSAEPEPERALTPA